MARKAIVNAAGRVENVIEIEADSAWPVPDGCLLVDDPNGGAEPGGTYAAGTFTQAPRPLF